MYTLSKAHAVKLSLIIVPMLLLSVFVPLPLPGAMGVAHAASCPPTISSGSSGTWVGRLQGTLNLHILRIYDFSNSPYTFSPPLAVDGRFGSNTKAAVEDYQKAKGLHIDGIVGPQTWGSLGFCSGKGSTGSVSGGGCTTTTYATVCISDSNGSIVPDIYLRTTSSDGIDIILAEDGTNIQDSYFLGTYSAGAHLYGPLGFNATSGRTWQTFAVGFSSTGGHWGGVSPVQFT
jgi:hypothetical protein